MSPNTISTIAFVLCMIPGILHAIEVAFPMLSRLIVNYVLPFFEPRLPKGVYQITAKEQTGMLDAAISSVEEEKRIAAKDYVFLLLFEQRQNSLVLWAIIADILYGFQLPLDERVSLHFLLLVMSVLFMLVNANHAGVSFLGHNPKVSRNGRNVGFVFVPFWLAAAIFNYWAFTYAPL